MTTTPFQDTLMIDNWDVFKSLVADLKQLKATLKNESRRRNRPVCSYMAYDLIKKIADPIVRVMNGRRISENRALELFGVAIRKVNLLVREMLDYGRRELAQSLQDIEQKLLSLLPLNAYVQLELFEPERYDTGKKKPLTFICFDRWKREALIQRNRRIHQAICDQADRYEQKQLNRVNKAQEYAVKAIQIVKQSFSVVC